MGPIGGWIEVHGGVVGCREPRSKKEGRTPPTAAANVALRLIQVAEQLSRNKGAKWEAEKVPKG